MGEQDDVVVVDGCVIEGEGVVRKGGAFPVDSGGFVSDSVAASVPAVPIDFKIAVAEGGYFHAAVVEGVRFGLAYGKEYEVDDIEAVCGSLRKLHREVEPLGVASRVDVVLQHELVFVGEFLP